MLASRKPDIELKIFPLVKDYEENKMMLRELQEVKEGLVVKLVENIHGNVFNRPFPYIHLRNIESNENLPKDLKNDGDPWKDYFYTIRSVYREKKEKTLGFIFMGYKVLNDDQVR